MRKHNEKLIITKKARRLLVLLADEVDDIREAIRNGDLTKPKIKVIDLAFLLIDEIRGREGK
jgi:hypothetical protein